MKIVQGSAYFICSDDPSFGEPMEEHVHVINSALTLSIYEDQDFVFREIKEWNAEGFPVVDLAMTRRLEFSLQPVPEDIDVNWMLGANLLDVVQRLLK